MLRRSTSTTLFLGLALPFLLAGTTRVEAQTALGDVRAREYSPSPVAIPPFGVDGSTSVPASFFAPVIARDLELSGFFKEPGNPRFVQETHELDLAKNTVHYAEWYRLGVAYVVKGKLSQKGDKLEAEVRTYDTAAGRYIFGKLYTDYPASDPRKLAHYVANDIIEKITGQPGTANTRLLVVGETDINRGTLSKEIFLVDADGENRTQVTTHRSLTATPAWGARGTEIYFTTYRDYNPDLMGLILTSDYSWFVSRRAGFNLSPDWSEKNQSIALTLSRDGNSEVYTMGRDGKNPKRLSFNRGIDSSPCWSPDGRQIAFTSDRTGTPQIHLMDGSGLNVRRLTTSGQYNDGASWRPQGDLIAFTCQFGGVFQICTVSPAGGEVRQLTRDPYNSEDPVWSPNGYVIAYTSERAGKKQVHTMFVDGRPLAQLTKGKAHYSADWSPLVP